MLRVERNFWKRSRISFPVNMELFFNLESLLLIVILGIVHFLYFWLIFFGFRYMEGIQKYRGANLGPSTVKSFHTWIRFGGKDRPGFVWKKKMDVKWRKARNCISKIQKNTDDKNDNENNLTEWDRLGWTKETLPVHHNLDDFKQYNFTNCNVTLQE